MNLAANQIQSCRHATPYNPAFQTFVRESFRNWDWDFASLRARRFCIIVVVPSLPIVFFPSLVSGCKLHINTFLFRAAAAAAVAVRHELLCLDNPMRTGLQHMRRRHSSGTRINCTATRKGRGGKVQWRNYMGAAGTQRVHGIATHNVYCVSAARMLVHDRHEQTDERCGCTHAQYSTPEGWQR